MNHGDEEQCFKRIETAQRITVVRTTGVDLGRIRYGEEKDDWGADRRPCHDCGAVKGQFHVPGFCG